MRVAVWNLGHWERSPAQLQTAWGVLSGEIGADVALLQEAVPPSGVHAVYQPIGNSRPWGSAVVGFTVDLEQVTHARGRANNSPQPLEGTWPGSVAVATANVAGRQLTFVSVYGLIDDGYADATVHRHLSDLTPLLDSPAHEGGIILGGDLNITTQWTGPDEHYRQWAASTFARIESFGLVDCLDSTRPPGPLSGCDCAYGDQCRHIQTQRNPRSPRPWQNDYLFASRALAGYPTLKAASVHDSDQVRSLGGHLPLVADFEVPAGQ